MKILLAGLPNVLWDTPPECSVIQSPLGDAGTLTEYDLVVLKPSLFGGIFDVRLTKFTESNYGLKVLDSEPVFGRYLHTHLEDLVPRMIEIGLLNRLVIIPCSENALYYREPRVLEDSVAALNRLFGRTDENYTPFQTISNLDLVKPWRVAIQNNRAGNSVKVTTPGHPMAKYLSLSPMSWEATYEVNGITQRELASDALGLYSAALEAEIDSSRLIVVPEARCKEGLSALLEAMHEREQWYSWQRIRSGRERQALEQISLAYQNLDVARRELAESHQKLLECVHLTDEQLAAVPILSSILEDYNQGLLQGPSEGLTFFYRAWERLKKDSGKNEKDFMNLMGISKKEKGAITKVANASTRHPPSDDFSQRPTVTSDQFEEARSIVQNVLERYVDYLYKKGK